MKVTISQEPAKPKTAKLHDLEPGQAFYLEKQGNPMPCKCRSKYGILIKLSSIPKYDKPGSYASGGDNSSLRFMNPVAGDTWSEQPNHDCVLLDSELIIWGIS